LFDELNLGFSCIQRLSVEARHPFVELFHLFFVAQYLSDLFEYFSAEPAPVYKYYSGKAEEVGQGQKIAY
jgi:hypothetical protein